MIERDKTESGQTVSLGRSTGSGTRREAEKGKLSGKQANNQLLVKSAPYPSGTVNIKGSRASSTNYYIDGMRVSGGTAATQPAQLGEPARKMPSTPLPLEKERLKSEAADTKSVPDSLIESNEEQYNTILENPYQETSSNNISTFSIDVDAASYANLRRYIDSGQMPPRDAVRIEEMVNYFDYQYPQPTGPHPFEVSTELAPCPWAPEHRLLLIGLQGQTMDLGQLPAANLVFLIDVSGSMSSEDKLPLVQQSLHLLTDQLRPNDRVAIVVYAGAAGTVLESTPGTDKLKIKEAINHLQSGGSTAGGEGIQLAYKMARKNFVPSGNNRVILCTDGDFNVGVSSEADLVKLIENERLSGVYLTVLGFGTGNYQDGKMQELADKGNGNHAYIDGLPEAKKVLVQEFGGTLFAIAKDVKLQLHFNPAQIAGYRLIGYENRMLATEDFQNDKKDAGELGAGHRVTALYELIPVGQTVPPLTRLDSRLVVVSKPDTSVSLNAQDLFVLQLRYKQPKGEQPSRLMEYRLPATALGQASESENLLLASTVAEFGLLLRDSKYKGVATYQQTLERARKAA
ncbi:MAG: VWA domain-containing protein, partial [Saprospiraceae bacterium]